MCWSGYTEKLLDPAASFGKHLHTGDDESLDCIEASCTIQRKAASLEPYQSFMKTGSNRQRPADTVIL